MTARWRSIHVDARPEDVVTVLGNRDLAIRYMPYITGLGGGKIVIQLRRFRFLRFTDAYRVEIRGAGGSTEIALLGRSSVIRFMFRPGNSNVEYLVERSGIGRWAGKLLDEMAEALVRGAEKEVGERTRAASSGEYSEKLSYASWIARLVMKGILIRNDVRVLEKGELLDYIEELAGGERLFDKYNAVYISGDADGARFRLIFINGELRGVYIVADNKEYFGDEKALNLIHGLTRIRVYGLLKPP